MYFIALWIFVLKKTNKQTILKQQFVLTHFLFFLLSNKARGSFFHSWFFQSVLFFAVTPFGTTLFFFRLSLLTTRGCSFVSHTATTSGHSLWCREVWWADGAPVCLSLTCRRAQTKLLNLSHHFAMRNCFSPPFLVFCIWPQATEQEVPWPKPWTHHSPQTSLNNTLTWCASVFRAQNENDNNLSWVSQWYRHKERSSVL